MSRNIFIGIDGEMSSPDLQAGGALIQIGAYGPIDDDILQQPAHRPLFSSLIRFDSARLWTEEAESIHGIRREMIESAPSAEEVDELFFRWLIEQGAQERRKLVIPVGMNVGSFDMPFVTELLPKSAALFTRRSVDLNGLCFSMDGMPYDGIPMTSLDWKTASLEFGRRMWAHEFGMSDWSVAHDAEFDAWVHSFSWEFLKSGMRGIYLPMPDADVPGGTLAPMISELEKHYGSLRKLAEASDVPEVFLKGWKAGGRPTRHNWVESLERLHKSLLRAA